MRRTKILSFFAGTILGLLPLASEAELKFMETADQRLLYFDPTQTYLAPYAARCFENSMGMQRQIFDYEPTETTTVIMTSVEEPRNSTSSTRDDNMNTLDALNA